MTAVGSRNLDSAVRFIAEHANGDPSIKAYSTYAEVYADSVSSHFRLAARDLLAHKEIIQNVDVIYIGWWQYYFVAEPITAHRTHVSLAGTPHAFHYENALDGIKAKKHVLCEKPVTLNAAELRSLLAAAKEYGVFFMEALWTRFQPLALEVKKIAESGVLGEPVALTGDLSVDFGINSE